MCIRLATPQSQGGGVPATPNFSDFLHVLTQHEKNSNKILYDDQSRYEEYFYSVDRDGRPCPGHNFVTRMLTRDLFAVANLVCSGHLQVVLPEVYKLLSIGFQKLVANHTSTH